MRIARTCIGTIALLCCLGYTAFLINGCSNASDNQELEQASHGSKSGDGYTFGTGPSKTKPYPQTSNVKTAGIPGAKPRYEPLSAGGNSDYRVLGQTFKVWVDCTSYQEVGTASWYGPGFHGNKTSNGELYNQKGFTAAHKNLPLPSYVKVTNLENGKAVIVRVNDRGPFHGSRIIDLSEGAAKAINMTKKGTARVKLELINTRGNSKTSSTSTSSSKTNKPSNITINSGKEVAQDAIAQVIKNKTSNETVQNLGKIGDFINERNTNGSASAATTAAAIGAGIALAGKANSNSNSLTDSPVSSSQANSLSSSKNEQLITLESSVLPANAKYQVDYAVPVNKNINSASNVSFSNTPSNAANNSNTTAAAANPSAADPSAAASTDNSSASVSSLAGSVKSNGPLKDASTGQQLDHGTYIQLFSSSTLDGARKVKSQMEARGTNPIVIISEGGLFRVRIGPVTANNLSNALEQAHDAGYPDAFVKQL